MNTNNMLFALLVTRFMFTPPTISTIAFTHLTMPPYFHRQTLRYGHIHSYEVTSSNRREQQCGYREAIRVVRRMCGRAEILRQ